MSDTATPGSLDAFLLDGEAPRLGAAPVLPPTQPAIAPDLPPADAVAPLVGDGLAPQLPSLPTAQAAAPALPTPSLPAPNLPAPGLATGAADPTSAGAPISDGLPGVPAPAAEPRHPMAHLMPAKSQPTESSAWAAELRAQKKAKARRTKIIVSVVMLAFCALVGPPLGKWLVNAINESGSTKPDTPAATVPAATAAPTTAPSAPAASAAPTTAGGLLGLPAQAEQAVADANATSPAAPATTVAP